MAHNKPAWQQTPLSNLTQSYQELGLTAEEGAEVTTMVLLCLVYQAELF